MAAHTTPCTIPLPHSLKWHLRCLLQQRGGGRCLMRAMVMSGCCGRQPGLHSGCLALGPAGNGRRRPRDSKLTRLPCGLCPNWGLREGGTGLVEAEESAVCTVFAQLGTLPDMHMQPGKGHNSFASMQLMQCRAVLTHCARDIRHTRVNKHHAPTS
jgi:hypothetical protein